MFVGPEAVGEGLAEEPLYGRGSLVGEVFGYELRIQRATDCTDLLHTEHVATVILASGLFVVTGYLPNSFISSISS